MHAGRTPPQPSGSDYGGGLTLRSSPARLMDCLSRRQGPGGQRERTLPCWSSGYAQWVSAVRGSASPRHLLLPPFVSFLVLCSAFMSALYVFSLAPPPLRNSFPLPRPSPRAPVSSHLGWQVGLAHKGQTVGCAATCSALWLWPLESSFGPSVNGGCCHVP